MVYYIGNHIEYYNVVFIHCWTLFGNKKKLEKLGVVWHSDNFLVNQYLIRKIIF